MFFFFYSREKMMNILDQHCAEENETIAQSGGVKSEYDFLYVPFDFKYDIPGLLL